ncbi:MAG: ATP-binding protein [Jatrophihabitans sp.]|uniref:ATP-binding protein n=1 Tax=Jatrophihabitans sp. TaxID=1932789 RepID=UPI003F7E0516
MAALDDPTRLAAVRAVGLVRHDTDEVLDRLTRIATRLLRVPVASVSLVSDTEHLFVSTVGVRPELLAAGGMPIDVSFCRYTVEAGATVAIPDTRLDPCVADNPAVTEYEVVAYAGHPVREPGGQIVGTFGVIDRQPHEWSVDDLATLEDLAHAAGAEIGLRLTTRKLEREQAFLRAVLDSVDDPVLAADPDGRVSVVNRAAVEAGAAGLPFDSTNAAAYSGVFAADGRTPLAPPDTPLSRALHGEQVQDVEIVSRRTDVERRYMVTGRPITSEHGTPLGAVVALHDVTTAHERQTLREALHAVSTALAEARSAEEATHAAIAALADALGWEYAEFWHADHDEQSLVRVTWWHREGIDAQALIDTAPAERPRGRGLVGRVWDVRRSVWVPDLGKDEGYVDRGPAALQAGLRTAVGLPVVGHGTLLGVIAMLRTRPVTAGPELVGVLEAVTAQIGEYLVLATERERLLHRQAEQLTALGEVSRMKSDLVAVVSHELRNPIAVIRAYAELLTDETDLDDEQRRFAEIIDNAAQRMMHIVTDLLTLAESDAGPLTLQQRTLALDEVLRAAADEQRFAADEKELSLVVDVHGTLLVHGDRDRLRQAIDNLLINAIKYTPNGGTVRVEGDIEDAEVVVHVRDTGIGVPPEQLPQLFTRFFRATTARRAGIRGTGLGLSITRRIVEAHGGTVEAAANEPAGTVFTVRLPLVAHA